MALCRMFNQAISGQGLPVRLSLDHDPLFEFQRWQANLRILGVAYEYKSTCNCCLMRSEGNARQAFYVGCDF